MKFQRKFTVLTGPGDRRACLAQSRDNHRESGGSKGGGLGQSFLLRVSVGRQGKACEKFRIGYQNHSGGLWTVEVVPSCLKSGPGMFK